MSAATELQSLEREIAILKKVLKSCQSTEKTSVAAVRVYTAITTCTAQNGNDNNATTLILDHFAPLPIPKGGGTTTSGTGTHSSSTTTTPAARNTYDADESGGGGDGCCVVC